MRKEEKYKLLDDIHHIRFYKDKLVVVTNAKLSIAITIDKKEMDVVIRDISKHGIELDEYIVSCA